MCSKDAAGKGVQRSAPVRSEQRDNALSGISFGLCVLLLLLTACAPLHLPTLVPTPGATPSPVPTASPTLLPTPVPTLPTPTAVPTATVGAAYSGQVEGLVMLDDSQLIIGVHWLSKSRVTYVIVGGEVEEVRKFLGETARVTGEIVDRSPWLKEIVVRKIEASTDPQRLSRRTGYIKELGPSIYMQGTHVLVDRDGKPICLLSAAKSGLDLNAYMTGKVVVYGVLTKTVEGDAQIMEVEQVEQAKP